MANKDGTIALRDIIEPDALRFGQIYADNLELAIAANKKLMASAKQLKTAMDSHRGAGSNKDLIESKNNEVNAINKMVEALKQEQQAVKDLTEERKRALELEKTQLEIDKAREKVYSTRKKALDEQAIATKKNTDRIKENEQAEKSNEKVKQEKLRTEKLELDLKNKQDAAQRRNTKLTIEEQVQNNELNKIKRQQAREALGLVGAYEKLNRQRTEAQRRLADLLASEQKNTREIQKAEKEYQQLNRRIQEVDRSVDFFHKNIGNYPTVTGYTDLIKSLVGAFGVVGGIQAFTTAVKNSFEILREYEAEIVNLGAIAGKTREEIQPLEETIRAVAAASINSATDVAKLATELIKLGSTPEEAEKLLKPVNDLSVALRASAEDAATLVKSLLNSYQVGADQAGRFADVIAESANRSALDFQGIRDAFSYLAPTANTLNFSIEKTAAILGILADNGIKAESAGRLTSTALIRLSQDGLSLEDALNKVNEAQERGATELEVLAIAGKLFGAESAKIGIILANNQDKIDENTKAYENSQGALEELTNKQLKSLSAQIEILDSAYEEYILAIDSSTGATKIFTTVIEFLSKNLDTILDILIETVALYATYRASVMLATLAQRAMVVSSQALAVAQGFVANGIKGARAEMQALNATTKLNPFGLILTAVVALIFVLGNLKKSLSQVNDEVEESTKGFLKSKEVQDKNIATITKMSNRYEELSGKVNKTTEEQKELADITKALGLIVPEATTKMNKYGDAIVLSSEKIKDYIKLQKEVIALKTDVELEKNVELLSKLREERERLNIAENAVLPTRIEGIGSIRRENGVLLRQSILQTEGNRLTKEELFLYKQQVLANEQQIARTNQRIKALKDLQTQALATNAATAGAAGAPSATPQERTIALIDAEIKAEKEKIDTLTYATRAEGKLIDQKIAKLEKEREAIYRTQKQERDYTKEREAELQRRKKIDEDAYNLTVFRLNRLKAQNDEIIEDENSTYDELIDSAIRNEAVLTAINEENAEKKLKDISQYNDKVRDLTDDEINILISGGTIKKQLLNEELLVLEQYQKDRSDIVKKGEAAIDKIQLDNFEKRLNETLRLNNISINNELIAENDRFNALNSTNQNREYNVEQHEKRIADIKKKYAIQALQDQIKSLEALLATETITAEKRKEIETQVSNSKKELSDLNLNYQKEVSKSYLDLLLGEELAENQKKERILELAQSLKDSLIDLSNAIFEGRIQKINDELAAVEEYYSKQLELAGDDQRQRELIEKEAEKKRQELEKKKREEQRKQAIFNKALKVADIIGSTALGIMQAYAQLGPIFGNIGAAIVAAMGAIQLAAVIAQPIPKYKGGRRGGPAEVAIVGDGGVQEVIEDKHGNIALTPNKSTIVKLQQGDSVHKSKEAYAQYLKTKISNDIDNQTNKARDIERFVNFVNNSDVDDRIEKAINRGFKNAKINIVNQAPKVDIGHSLWAIQNTKWQ